ncbi:fatty acid cis/trans isomerase [Oceanicoccus sp. KOV_DT_Chl]|uniref:fatty acid cis/trans isomerase n=1 Tax=Oceanicoccus sp. KOV_DT_Chl TaxID=1904639 RepID=UPI000C7A68DB|nr:fatty acid cis/trans isomerase [Oceanicoccus sp. KOV_DT_Chl]
MNNYTKRFALFILATITFSGCAVVAKHKLDEMYGPAQVVERTVVEKDYSEPEFYHDIKPIVDRRCVVCHGCYDAPCQLKMSSFESIDRGASKEKVYNGSRLVAGNLSRLTIDAGTTRQWREDGFFPVLNERAQSTTANQQASVMHRMLQLKQAHPLPETELLPDSFDLSLDRDQQCASIEDFDQFERDYPLWGMPYGLPAINPEEQATIERWLATGAKAKFPGIQPTKNPIEIEQWEQFLNGDSLKQKLMSRYIYEHLFLANIYFSNNLSSIGEDREFFKLVRSTTEPGQAIEIISSRRPFDDPGSDTFYYRLQRVKSTILAKQHMPYLFNPQRMQRWQQLFLDAEYTVTQLPGYDPELASNPFITFKEVPVNARYRFMLDEAQFTIMGFIKGPVCRGQVALNVINDHFWVLFTNPDLEVKYHTDVFLAKEAQMLRLPAEHESTALTPLTSWLKYSEMERSYLTAKQQRFDKVFPNKEMLDLSMLWQGDGHNQNASLTIFRHFDSSTVTKGLIGNTPKTAWVIGYPLLERIHYLLVAGFDVYGNAGHQLLTRLYMDFLRMEGEFAFLKFLPQATAEKEIDHWYRNAEDKVELYLKEMHSRNYETTGLEFKTKNPKVEFFNQVRQQYGNVVIPPDLINLQPFNSSVTSYQQQLQQLSQVRGKTLQHLPEQSLIYLQLDNDEHRLISLIRNRAHLNVSHLFGEQDRMVPKEQTFSVVEDVIGTYPNAFYRLTEQQLPDFVSRMSTLSSEQDYQQLLRLYGIRRNDKQFWAFSDAIHDHYLQSRPITAGLLDFNRIENR